MDSLVKQRIVGGRYEVREIRESGMSTVYEAVDLESGDEVVLKTARKDDFDRASALIREREMLVRLDHPGIVKALALVEEDDMLFLVLARVPGQDLAAILLQNDLRFDEARARDFCVQLAEVLQYLHTQAPPIIYRDLKPSNVMLGPDGRLVLIDFGAARVKTPSPRDTVALGTPGYAAPEQYGMAGSDERSDLYALGVTLFELLTRCDPADFQFQFPPLADCGVRLSPEFDRILKRLINAERAERFASAEALLAALRRKPARPPLPLAPIALAALLGAVAVSHGAVRIAAMSAMVAVAAGASGGRVVWRSIVHPVDRPALSRRVLQLAFGLGCAALIVLPLVIPEAVVESLLRRAFLFSGASAVPLHGPLLGWMLLSLWLLGVGMLIGHALGAPRGWKLLALVLGCSLSCLLTLGWSLASYDTPSYAIRHVPPAWTVDLGSGSDVVHRDLTCINMGDAERNVIAVRTENGRFTMYEAATGKALWTHAATPERPLHANRGEIVDLADNVVRLLDAASGKVLGTYRGDGPVASVWWPGRRGEVTLALADGRIENIDPTSGRKMWEKEMPRSSRIESAIDRIICFDFAQGALSALSQETGELLWSTSVSRGEYGGGFDCGGLWMFQGGRNVVILDPANGHVLLDLARVLGPVTGHTIARPIDPQHVVVQCDRQLYLLALDGDHARVVWQDRLDDDFELHGSASGQCYLVNRHGTVAGLDVLHNRVRWEWAAGGTLAQLWAQGAKTGRFFQTFGGGLWVQPQGVDELQNLDLLHGQVAIRLPLPRGAVVEAVNEDFSRLYMVVRQGSGSTLMALPRGLFADSVQNRVMPGADHLH
jgi:tRNA A-37 threonylcarbamoyl transferase component Bud32